VALGWLTPKNFIMKSGGEKRSRRKCQHLLLTLPKTLYEESLSQEGSCEKGGAPKWGETSGGSRCSGVKTDGWKTFY